MRRSGLPRWLRTGAWPAERTYAVFSKWFEVLFYPLIQDLVDDELIATEVDEAFIDGMRTGLEGMQPRT